MRKVSLLIFFVLFSFFLIPSAWAWDGKREGFILGAGIGAATTSYNQEARSGYVSVKGDTKNETGLGSSFRLGYAFSDQWEIAYVNRVNWFGIENAKGENLTIASTVTTINIAYYFSPTAPSWFLEAGVGLSSWDTPMEDKDTEQSEWGGAGLSIGGGYEFIPHLQTELAFVWGNPMKKDEDVKLTTNMATVLWTIEAVGY